MKRFSFILIILALFLIKSFFIPVLAADYYFYVDKNYSNVYINQDGSIDIEYFLTFTTHPRGKAIDIVDVGLPNNYYNLSTVKADINGVELSGIKKSSYISTGVEIPLTGNYIQPNTSKTLHLKINNPNMVFQDDADINFAAVEFYPTYYGSQYTTGTTDLKVSFYMPEGITQEQVVTRHNPETTFSKSPDNRLIVTWQNKTASPSSQYKFGISYPKINNQVVFTATEYTPASDYYTYGTSTSPIADIVCGPLPIFIIWGGIFLIGFISRRGLKNKYLPPKGVVEGFGANKQLKPAEVAIIKELPLKRVCAILFARMLKQRIILELDDDNTIRKLDHNSELRKNLSEFEVKFYSLLTKYEKTSKRTADKTLLKTYFITLIEDTVKKMKPYSYNDTINYFKFLTAETWMEINELLKSNNIFDLRKITTILDSNFELLMTDKDFPKKIKPILANPKIPKPEWIRNLKRLKGKIDTEMNKVSGKVREEFEEDDYDYDDEYYYEDYYFDIFDSYDYFYDCRLDNISMDVVKVTNPAVLTAKSYGTHGGGGCACACACACAGGGR